MRDRTVLRKQAHWSGQTKTRDSLRASMVMSRPRRPIRVFIADRHEVMRIGVRVILEEEVDLKVVGEVDTIDGLFSWVQQSKPNVILLDACLSEGLNADGYRRLFEALPSVRIIILMEDAGTMTFRHVVEDGVHGYLSKNTCREELCRTIRMVAKGSSYLGQEGAAQSLRFLRHQPDIRSIGFGLEVLSPQEQRIIAFIAEGDTNRKIATKLVLSEKTVKNYIANIFTKLGIERRTQAVAIYMRAQQQDKSIGEGASA